MGKTVTASELRVGDVVQINARAAWRVESVKANGTTVTVAATYTQCDFSPTRIGTTWTHRYRAPTRLTVTR